MFSIAELKLLIVKSSPRIIRWSSVRTKLSATVDNLCAEYNKMEPVVLSKAASSMSHNLTGQECIQESVSGKSHRRSSSRRKEKGTESLENLSNFETQFLLFPPLSSCVIQETVFIGNNLHYKFNCPSPALKICVLCGGGNKELLFTWSASVKSYLFMS